MSGALIVDWENLQICLKRFRYASSPQFLAEHLQLKARKWATTIGGLKSYDVFASERGFANTADVWIRTGYKVHLIASDREAYGQELEKRASELLLSYNEKYDFFIIVAGDYDYTPL